MRAARRALAFAPLILLAACATQGVAPPAAPPPPVTPSPTPTPSPAPSPPPPTTTAPNAKAAGFTVEAPRNLDPVQASRALAAFKLSCGAVTTRQDQSLLTNGADWQTVCNEARSLSPDYAPGFFYYRFDWLRVFDGRAFATGYYEPEIEGSRTPLPGYVPIYRVPADLVRCTRPDGGTGRGRIDPATGTCVLYFTRGEIDAGALAGRGLEIAWAKDPVDLFFAEIQGSAYVHFPDGSGMHIGYAGQNGRDYVAIGRLLRDRGILPPGGANMDSIKAWIRANPDAGVSLMQENLSYIFFKELPGGPVGALNVPVTPRGTVAADPKFVPLGAPVFLILDRAEATGIWVAQDVGGAIKGPNRFDTFWGAGADAPTIAGGMSASGQAWVLVPKGVGTRALTQP